MEPYVSTHEVRFKVRDVTNYDERELLEAFAKNDFENATVTQKLAK